MLNIYQQNIIDYYKNPRYHYALDDYDEMISEVNTICGDAVTIYIKKQENGKFLFSFVGEGCAISQAATSMLLEDLNETENIEEIKDKINLDYVKSLLGIPLDNPARLKCANLCIVCLRKSKILGFDNNDQ